MKLLPLAVSGDSLTDYSPRSEYSSLASRESSWGVISLNRTKSERSNIVEDLSLVYNTDTFLPRDEDGSSSAENVTADQNLMFEASCKVIPTPWEETIKTNETETETLKVVNDEMEERLWGHTADTKIFANVQSCPPIPSPRVKKKLKASHDLNDLRRELQEKDLEITNLRRNYTATYQENMRIKQIVKTELEEIRDIKNVISEIEAHPDNKEN